MEPLAFIRRSLLGALGTVVGLVVMAIVASANEVPAASHPAKGLSGIQVHSAAETEANFCRTDTEGRTWFTIPGGATFELVTSVDDPAIVNKGDGEFHTFEVAEIQAALNEVSFPLADVRTDVYVLPFPRRTGLESAAGPGLILLSPGVRHLSSEHQHAELIHELGHVVQYVMLPDAARDGWNAYRQVRGIQDESYFSSNGVHSHRPHEIFAEDFRALFGGSRANYSGTIENATLQHPATVAGLREFMLTLANGLTVSTPLQAFPNPSHGAVTFTRMGATATTLDLFDAQGRRVASVEPTVGSRGAQWTWDALDHSGRRLQPGIFFARARDPKSRTVRVTLTP